MDTDNRYTINRVNFTADTYNQLSWQPTAGSRVAGAISDLNTQPENADYAVLVVDALAKTPRSPAIR